MDFIPSISEFQFLFKVSLMAYWITVAVAVRVMLIDFPVDLLQQVLDCCC